MKGDSPSFAGIDMVRGRAQCNFTRDFLIPEERSNCPDNVDIAFEEMVRTQMESHYDVICYIYICLMSWGLSECVVGRATSTSMPSMLMYAQTDLLQKRLGN